MAWRLLMVGQLLVNRADLISYLQSWQLRWPGWQPPGRLLRLWPPCSTTLSLSHTRRGHAYRLPFWHDISGAAQATCTHLQRIDSLGMQRCPLPDVSDGRSQNPHVPGCAATVMRGAAGIVNVAAVDCDEHKSIAGEHGIQVRNCPRRATLSESWQPCLPAAITAVHSMHLCTRGLRSPCQAFLLPLHQRCCTFTTRQQPSRASRAML